MSTAIILLLAFAASLFLSFLNLTLPYNLFTYVAATPTSLPEIGGRHPLPAAAFLVHFLTLFGFYLLAYRACRQRPSARLVPLILACGLLLTLPLLLVYPIGAGDVVDYVSHGEVLAFFGVNPLVIPPADVPGTNLVHYSAYRYVPSNYGPLWTQISGLVVCVLGNHSLLLNLLGFKAVAIAAYLMEAVLIYAILRRRDPLFAPAGLLLFAWNPLVLYESAVNGHNDGMMMAFALLGFHFWERERPLAMAAALTLSFLVKIPTLPLLLLFLLAAACRRRQGWRFWFTLLSGGSLAAWLVAIAYLSLPDPWAALTNLASRADLFSQSLPTLVKLGLQTCGMREGVAQDVARWGALLGLGGCAAVQAVRTWHAPTGVLAHAYDLYLFLLLFATPWFQPWYVTWLVALAALRPRPHAPTQASLFSLTVLSSYVVFGFVWFWIPRFANWGHNLGINLLAVLGTYTLPWAYTAWVWYRQRRASHER